MSPRYRNQSGLPLRIRRATFRAAGLPSAPSPTAQMTARSPDGGSSAGQRPLDGGLSAPPLPHPASSVAASASRGIADRDMPSTVNGYPGSGGRSTLTQACVVRDRARGRSGHRRVVRLAEPARRRGGRLLQPRRARDRPHLPPRLEGVVPLRSDGRRARLPPPRRNVERG